MKRKKEKSPTWYRKKCVEWAKKQAKERDRYVCQKSGVKVEGMNAHGAHILPEGAYPLMSAEPYNIITLSYRAHINWWHKSPHEAAEWFDKKWPGRYKELRAMAEGKKNHVINWKLKYESLA